MSEPFRPYEKTCEHHNSGQEVPGAGAQFAFLRCFQFISPETIPYGRFCWNQGMPVLPRVLPSCRTMTNRARC